MAKAAGRSFIEGVAEVVGSGQSMGRRRQPAGGSWIRGGGMDGGASRPAVRGYEMAAWMAAAAGRRFVGTRWRDGWQRQPAGGSWIRGGGMDGSGSRSAVRGYEVAAWMAVAAGRRFVDRRRRHGWR